MDVRLSRRNMLVAGGAAIVAPLVLSGDKKVEASVSPLSSSDRAIMGLSGTDARFPSAVQALFPGLPQDPVFQKIMPLALLVTHQSGPGVRALSIEYSITTPTGTSETPVYLYISPGSKSKGESVSTLGSARQEILQAGQSRLVTPFFNWTPAYYQRSSNPDWKSLIQGSEPGDFLVSELSTATEIKVSVDGVVFSDRKLLGPDKFKLGRRIRARRNAEHDEALGVYKLLQSGASDDTIRQTLQSHGSAPRSNQIRVGQRTYEQARRYHAQVLLRAFNDADRNTFTKALIRLKRQKKMVLTKLG